jgi:hypothetical protein
MPVHDRTRALARAATLLALLAGTFTTAGLLTAAAANASTAGPATGPGLLPPPVAGGAAVTQPDR